MPSTLSSSTSFIFLTISFLRIPIWEIMLLAGRPVILNPLTLPSTILGTNLASCMMSGRSSSSLLSISALSNSIRMTSLSVLCGSTGFFSGAGGGVIASFFCGGACVLVIRPLPKNILYVSSPLVRTMWFPKT